ncbi:MAG: mandelate racemase/muconate lactonizing enzyme family protein [Rhodospirillaceae bacterium]|jgi:L-rhamnonate dehydratase|nr:mandelate racemase/muconate lactonizing enzyme family protein [Rhodospirillaceae bacterium]
MKITRVQARPLRVEFPIGVLGMTGTQSMNVVFAEVETDDGHVGYGFSAITNVEVVAAAINKVAGPAILGDDPIANDRIWDKLYWLLCPRGQGGHGMHAIAAIDVALWDIKGKALGLPVWRLLGGARDKVPVYATFGFGFFDRDQLGDAAKLWMAQGFDKLKMTVGMSALARRDEPRPLDVAIREDVARVRAVRDAAGPDVEIYIDANCSLDPFHAVKLAKQLEPFEIAFFEEPINQNDIRPMVEMRRQTSIPLACGQNEGQAHRFRDLMIYGAVDVLQPNVVISGGFTQCAKIAGMAQAFNVTIDNGGAWPFHNMHLHAGVANGGLVECHYLSIQTCKRIFKSVPEPEDGWLALPEAPGLGLDPDLDAVRDLELH